MKFTILSIMALVAASSVSALPSDRSAVAARNIDASIAQFASLHTLDKRGKANGQRCKEDKECDTDFCLDPGFFSRNHCADKLKNGHKCKEDGHCVSGYCKHISFWEGKKCETNHVKAGSLQKGAKCDRNFECASEFCDGAFGYKNCALRQTGEPCKKDATCESGFCYIHPSGESRNRCLETKLDKGKYCVNNVQCKSKQCNVSCE
ncbi:keratin-associated protein [Pseudozyma hubeiensis SY62]|uniref:Keratin-associated protein n=1 Tax=Pseudozyma hubeiensis (strain SY62) TaxID=1305764 RepID=R9NYU2_PSEHS|nr:keratin-associated protein [Pseudozyma hubeiensis SY62]GAC93894.1 keratin-associated protein [Pseudozyma hubeiensis SY62]